MEAKKNKEERGITTGRQCAAQCFLVHGLQIVPLTSRMESFHRIGPLGQFDLVVAMSVYVFVCPFSCDFFLGLSLALRSHDQIPASHWSTPLVCNKTGSRV